MVVRSSRHQNGKCGNYTSLFCRGRHGLARECVPHVQHTYFLLFLPRPIKFLIYCVVSDAKALYFWTKDAAGQIYVTAFT